MNIKAGLFFLGAAFALVLALGIPSRANAFVNGTGGRLILVDDVGIRIGPGIGVDIGGDHVDRCEIYDRDLDRDRAYDQDRLYDPDVEHGRIYEHRETEVDRPDIDY